MVSEPMPQNASLAEILSARARRTPVDRLALDIAGGTLVALAAVWAKPSGWVAVLAAALCFLAYGGWALAERRLSAVTWPERAEHEPAWRALHAVTAVVGLGAFGLLLFACLGIALGRIIS